MPIYKLKLIDRRVVADNTIACVFEKPANFNFVAGQYGGFTLINPIETDQGGITRRFSILSAPHDEHLAIATRVQQSAFKRNLEQLPIGSEIKFAGPTGNFVLDETNAPIALIAGGIGVAPFYSMIRHATQQQSTRPIFLFYGNQQHKDAPFLEELLTLQQENPHFTFIPTMSSPDVTWTGETGYISDSMIAKHIPDLSQPHYYVCGSPVMVNALQNLLREMEIAEERIKVEDFPGY